MNSGTSTPNEFEFAAFSSAILPFHLFQPHGRPSHARATLPSFPSPMSTNVTGWPIPREIVVVIVRPSLRKPRWDETRWEGNDERERERWGRQGTKGGKERGGFLCEAKDKNRGRGKRRGRNLQLGRAPPFSLAWPYWKAKVNLQPGWEGWKFTTGRGMVHVYGGREPSNGR